MRMAGEWISAGRDESFLLRGERLTQFESWAGDSQLAINADGRAFLSASIALREEKTAAERRGRQRTRALLIALAVVMLVVAGLGIVAISLAREQRITEEFQRLALLRDLTSAARANLEIDPELASLLALEAAGNAYEAEGHLPIELEDLLHQTVQADSVQQTIKMSGEVAYSPDGQLVAVGDDEGLLRIWDAKTGDDIWGVLRYQGRNQEIGDIAFSPDGRYLATSSPDSLLKIWDVNSGQEIGVIEREEGFTGVAFSPDGRYLVAAGSDGTIDIYIMAAEELMEAARSRLSRDFTQEECRTYLPLDSCPE
jgi:hypothetical protein